MNGLWQICVINGGSTMLITVSENCTTEEFFKALRKHPNAPRADNFHIWPISGDSRGRLTISSTERLSDYDITHLSTLVLVARLAESAPEWPTAEEIETVSRKPEPADGITITTISDDNPDVFGIEFDGPAVVMQCGHAVAPLSLTLYCHSELKKGESEILCPKCGQKWKFAHLKSAACLTPDETTEFETEALINCFRSLQDEMKPCPRCKVICTRYRNTDVRLVCSNCSSNTGNKFEFCWICLREWKSSGIYACGNPKCGSREEMFEILKTCKEAEMRFCQVKVPAIRACPKCTVPIQHDGGCKHMTCKNCKYEFCFICLKKYVKGSTDVYKACSVAPRQTEDTVGIVTGICGSDQQEQGIRVPDSSSSESNCTIL